MEACDSLCIGKSLKTYKLLKKIAEKDKNGLVRGYAISSLGDVAVSVNQQNDLIDFLERKLLEEKVEFTQIYTYTVLYNLGREEYLLNLIPMINSQREKNRCEVVNSLSEIVNEGNKEVILKALLKQKEIEKSGTVVSIINETLEKIERS